jgi:alanine-glyoxylate transaminase/serine-glyoxylate transaminase/serine-pyruvate transaminase
MFAVVWIRLMKRLNFDVEAIESEWGEGPDLAALQKSLQADRSHAVKAICVVHNETSTGVTTNLALIRKAIGTLAPKIPQTTYSIVLSIDVIGHER